MQDKEVKYSKGYKYYTRAPYHFEIPIFPDEDIVTEFFSWSKNGNVEVFCHYAWDGASGPTVDTISSIRGSLEHDVGYQFLRLLRSGLLNITVSEEQIAIWKDIIDSRLHDTCTADGMFFIRADVWEMMVSYFGGSSCESWSEPEILTAP